MTEWISVKDRLPGDGEDLLFAHRHWDELAVDKGWFMDGKFYVWGCDEPEKRKNVVYWMPIPPLPENPIT